MLLARCLSRPQRQPCLSKRSSRVCRLRSRLSSVQVRAQAAVTAPECSRRPQPLLRRLFLQPARVRRLNRTDFAMGIRFLLSKRQANRTEAGVDVPKLLVRNQTRSAILADSADVATSSTARRKGLLGRQTFRDGEGLWIIPCESVHTCGMKFPIDLIYLNRKKRVRKICASVVPWRLSMCFLAHSVLELPAGTIDRTHTRPGDQLELSQMSQHSPLADRERRQHSDTDAIEV